jgi:plasmid stability protein
MDTTIRNLDEDAYRALKARAALRGTTIGELMNEAIRLYLSSTEVFPKTRSILDWVPVDFPEGDEHLSDDIDLIVYGVRLPGRE